MRDHKRRARNSKWWSYTGWWIARRNSAFESSGQIKNGHHLRWYTESFISLLLHSREISISTKWRQYFKPSEKRHAKGLMITHILSGDGKKWISQTCFHVIYDYVYVCAKLQAKMCIIIIKNCKKCTQYYTQKCIKYSEYVKFALFIM